MAEPMRFRVISDLGGFAGEYELVEIKPLTEREMRPIVCEPVPGPNGTINYVQDWSDLTRFG